MKNPVQLMKREAHLLIRKKEFRKIVRKVLDRGEEREAGNFFDQKMLLSRLRLPTRGINSTLNGGLTFSPKRRTLPRLF
ncbi:hypothetical protein AKJ37_04010 [candidate division MSBL1 archaeon SCGC-AAA259I09]|uniref:Uncharacterized protein n=1 Tax=candidate division MSBL1 archaeon SCGC-AAA259I09 TaxID=1698267 RepID=A0A133USA0_9EURY|nr:hypothetical protein AKJ37_04010 [candidate division MSBL1 archaeon SCGC-AAA259I09]